MRASLAAVRTVKGWLRGEASLALLIGLLLCSASPLVPSAHAVEPNSRSDRTSSSAAIRTAVDERLAAGLAAAGETRRQEHAALLDYYASPDHRLLWVDNKGLNRRANDVIEEIGKADDYGLRASDYALPTLNSESLDANRLAEAEIEISLAVMRYASDARGGRIDPGRLSANLEPTLALPKLSEVIDSIAIRADPAAYLRSFQPAQSQFEALRKALIAARGGGADSDVSIPDGPLLQLGVEHEQVALLRKRLQVPTENKAYETMFDAALADAVKRFKAAHGALPDGIVGPETRRLLNQPRRAANPERVRLILVNMERWRWLPNDLGSSYVMVNVPEFAVELMRGGRRMQAARVVVGEPDYQTPVFSSEIREIVFNPSWTVPDAIKTGEILPHILNDAASRGADGFDTSVLEANNLHVSAGGREIDPSAIDWSRVDLHSLNLYQPPGPDNVLGRVKFVFAGKHDISMHDTPHQEMFAEPVRAESFGTVRVQGADRLALQLLQQDQGWTGSRVASAIQNGYDQHVALKQPIPAYLTYFTLWVNDDGSTSTFPDIYGHDARMAAALAESEPVADRAAGGGGEAVASREMQGPARRNGRAFGNTIAESLSGFLEN